MKTFLHSDAVTRYSELLEESSRSNEANVKYYEEPAAGTLGRAKNKRHQMVFGRRGSGKSSLLRKTRAELSKERRPIAFVDLEPFKGHLYPDLLLSVLIKTFDSFEKWFEGAAIVSAAKKSWWTRLFGGAPKNGPINKAKADGIVVRLKSFAKELAEKLHSPDSAKIKEVFVDKSTLGSKKAAGAKIGASSVAANASYSSSEGISNSQQLTQQYKADKVEYLKRHIMDYQSLFDDMAQISGGDCFILLDDLYQIRRNEQAAVVDYLHSISKGHNVWLKIGTIRHRTTWYIHGNPPIGMKLGDDADEINLDLTLEKYQTTKSFLISIMTNLATDAGIDLRSLMTDVAIDRLILASGGVARDMLGILRRSIAIARERQNLAEYPKIGAEDVNIAAGEYDTTKRDELEIDTYSEDRADLNSVFDRIRNFCIDETQTNCFLIPQDSKGKVVDAINELVDLKLLHRIRSRVTVKTATQRGKVFQAFMLDLSQYAGTRKRRNMKVIEFWRSGADEELRRASLIFNCDPET